MSGAGFFACREIPWVSLIPAKSVSAVASDNALNAADAPATASIDCQPRMNLRNGEPWSSLEQRTVQNRKPGAVRLTVQHNDIALVATRERVVAVHRER